ncbi:ATP-dependent helicase HrpB [Asanoa sp. WMMD1127]|uniref:ATP-dependent helicase HrpB n=1 Tax=Asanoa sp. WMMD1127 TaxID=3016107 RepID=UPI00241765FE|nr:ATP-dependent helicase HrpB [Asanoa sp. WMMD1127]MDG4825817.1 ATP-dependent helicase HrpB [Asanoa sp. WMMD1127]
MLPDEPDLPIRRVLPQVRAALDGHGSAVLVAPPGTGKTTLVPLDLAAHGRVLVAEPRRLATRAAARRMAVLVGSRVGDAVGYAVRGDRRSGPATRVEVVTTGLLVRRLQHDPALDGVDTVILDECHERHLDSDLALAFCVDVRANLRPDLRLLATSATADTARLADLLGPTVTADDALHPVDVVWAPPPKVDPPHGLRVDPRLLDHVAAVTRRAFHERDGDILVFLPGAGEIAAVGERLRDLPVHSLLGRQDAAAQDAVLRPSARRRVVLATAVAESSLTVPGVRVVVDAGLARVPRTDHARGLGALVTVPVSKAAAEQRAGRAGREAPGAVYRCWSQAAHDRLPARPEPEIAAADLTGFALDLALWGAPGGSGLALPDPPPAGPLSVATETLRALGAVDAAGRVTERGRRIAGVGTHPRLARALLDGAALVGAERAASVVALLDRDLAGADLVAGWRQVRGEPAFREEARRLRNALGPVRDGPRAPDDLAAGLVVGLAYPERLAKVRTAGGSAYLMTGGTAADLPPGSGLAGADWLAVAAADRPPGRASARIRAAVAIDEATAREAGADLLTTDEEVRWSGGDVVARRVERLGAVPLVERPLSTPAPALVAAALADGLRREGLGLLRWDRAAVALRQRLAFARQALGEPWPDVSDAALLDRAGEWLDLGAARRRADLGRIDVAAALRRLLPWQLAGRLDAVAPERVAGPGERRLRVDYSDPEAPVVALKVQEAFGWLTTPLVAEGRVPVLLHLLSPAGRPVAVTRDLASFWENGYPRVRAELRGRYPRHAWPADPTG